MVADGDYEIRLRRWPEEADLPINAPLAPGADVPGVKAYRTTDGKAISPNRATIQIGDVASEAKVEPGAKEVTFNLKLKAGKTRMKALFVSEDGEEHGAYFTYVLKK